MKFAFWPEKVKFSVTLAEKVPTWPEFDPNFNLRLCEEKIIIYKQHYWGVKKLKICRRILKFCTQLYVT